MSDENQPNEVVESQLKPDSVAPEPAPVVEPEVQAATPMNAPETIGADAAPETVPIETMEPAVVSIADLEASQPTTGDKLGGIVASIGAVLQGRRWILGVAAGLVVVVILAVLLSSLFGGGGGYTALDADNPSIEHSDGLTVAVNDPSAAKVRMKLTSVPQADFVAGSVSNELEPALEALPSSLAPKSPYYVLDTKGKDASGPATMEIVIPNAAEPWETLDLYAWDGEAWHWLPSKLDRDAETLISEVDALPASVIVMQTGMVPQQIAIESEPFAMPGADAGLNASGVSEVDVPGILIGTMGGVTGDATQLPVAAQGGGMALVPMVRNWVVGRDPNWALVSDMLNMEADRTAHVQNLLGVVQAGGYAGLVVDYRALPAGDRDVFSAFVTDLGKAFDDNDLWLGIVVETPQAAGDSWDTGGYDWMALGAAVDQLRVVMPLSPGAYAPGGVAEQMVMWAVTQVNRQKLMPVFTTLSTDGEKTLALDAILAPLGGIQVTSVMTESVLPGAMMNFQLGGAAVETDVATGATRVTVGETTQWLGTPEWLSSRMDLAARYHLGGVMVRDMLHEGNMPGVGAAVAAYQAGTEAAASAMPEITWQVTDPGGNLGQSVTPLTQSQFAWVAPDVTGTYKIGASISGLDKGAVDVLVSVPAPVISETVAITETEGGSEATTVVPGDEEGATETETEDETPVAGFVTDVTVPDNTVFEKEEQFTKTWRMRNKGATAWPEDTKLVFESGEQMTDVAEVEIGVVEPGEDVDISVEMTAPAEDGSYKSSWQIQVGDTAVDGGGIYTVIQVGEQAAAPEPGNPPAPIVAPVSGGGFELGGHVRDVGLPYADKMHYSGMNWTKVQVHFGQDASGLIATSHANGFKIQLSALGSSGMVVDPGFEQEYANWVAGLAAAGADAIEVWNEPNIDREWQIGHISPQAYTNLLCTAYNAIKGANAGTAVISAAPAPTGWFGGCGPNGCDDLPWMQGLYNAGAANCMDYIGAHHNAGATSPSARSGHPADPGSTHHSWFFLPQTELYFNTFGGARKLFYTEMGYASQEGVPTFSDQFAWARGTNNAQQAAWLAEAVQLGSNTGMVRCIIVWNIDFVRYGTDPQDGFAILRPGGGCAACESLHAVLGTR